MDWDRDRRFDDSRRRESYRPVDRSNRSPLRNRSPPRQGADTWVPSNGRSTGRPRSRSPNIRRSSRSPNFRGRDTGLGFPRGRSPPRRFSPRREERQWSPSSSRRSRSPYGQVGLRSTRPSRARSPPMKRGREPSPAAFNARSPKRDRVTSPPRGRYDRPQSPPSGPRQLSYAPRRGGFYPASRTTSRRDPPKEPYEDSWRRRSPSDPRSGRYDYSSGQASVNAPRRASPPTRPQRFGSSHSLRGSHSPTHGRPRQNEPPVQSPTSDVRPPLHAGDNYTKPSPTPHTAQQRGHTLHSPPTRHTEPHNSQLQRDAISVKKDQIQHGITKHMVANQPMQPLQPTSPQVPNKPQASPPTGPLAAPIPSSGSSRPANLSLLSAPTRPKGGQSYRGDNLLRESTAPGVARRGPPSTHSNPPTGPRSTFSPAATNYENKRARHNSNTSQIHPRTQRLTGHLSSGPVLVPGGKLLLSGLDSTTEKRLAQLELDKERLLEQIAEKQKLKRDGLRDWERLETESAVNALRSDLADGHLQRMAEGDNIGGGVAF